MKCTILTAMIALLTVLPVSAQVYRWVDGNGQVHYSSEPPEGKKVEQIRTPMAKKINSQTVKDSAGDEKKETEEAKQAVYNREVQQQAAQSEAQRKVACESMRKDLALYQNYPRARVEVDGVARRLTPNELNTRIKQLQDDISKGCQDY